jgi:hypothetical protein
VTVVVIRSASYTGTTWVNLLLACHPRAFALGPPQHVLEKQVESGADAGGAICKVHHGECPFWPEFLANYDRAGNFYVQLADASGKDVIVLNNPYGGTDAERHLDHPDVLVREIAVVRDGRAILRSYGRYHPEADFVTSVREWFAPFAESFAFDRDDPDALAVTYEEIVRDQRAFLDRAGAFIGIEYPENALRFWEFEHHPIAGNGGTMGLLRRHLGKPFVGTDKEYREERYQRMLETPEQPVHDERWREEWGERDRLLFDHYAGAINARWGYERDRFSAEALAALHADLGDAASAPVPVPPPVASALPPGPKVGLCGALAPRRIREHGLHLAPRQTAVVAALSLVAVAGAVLGCVTLAILLVR